MANFNLAPAFKPWSWPKRKSSSNEYEYAKGSLREQLNSLPQSIGANHTDLHPVSDISQVESFEHDAMVRDPLTGKCLGRVRLPELAFDKPLINFQLIKGSLKSAWVRESVLLVCPLNGPARYIKVMAHPPDDCDIGIFRVEQNRQET